MHRLETSKQIGSISWKAISSNSLCAWLKFQFQTISKHTRYLIKLKFRKSRKKKLCTRSIQIKWIKEKLYNKSKLNCKVEMNLGPTNYFNSNNNCSGIAYCLLILDINISFKSNIRNHCRPSNFFWGALKLLAFNLFLPSKNYLVSTICLGLY